MNKRELRLLFFSVILSVACHSPVHEQLNLAASLMDSRPDSALTLIRSVPPRELRTTSMRARHALLLSMAWDKNYIDETEDSVINLAVDYYSRHGTEGDRMKAWYYQGIVRKNAKRYPAAIVSFERAEKEAEALHNYRYLGLINRNKASIFNATNNAEASLEYSFKSMEAFEANRDSLYVIYLKLSIAMVYINNNQVDEALALLNELRHQTTTPIFRTQCDIGYARALVEKRDSLPLVVSIYRRAPIRLLDVLDFGYYAIALYGIGQRDSAYNWLKKGYELFPYEESTASLQHMHSGLAFQDGDFKSAYKMEHTALMTQDSLTRVLLRQSLSNAQRDYYREEAVLQAEIVKRQRAGIIYGSIITALFCALLLLFGLQWKSKKENLLKEQMAKLSLLRDSIIYDNAHLVGALMRERIMRLYHLSNDYFKEENPGKKEKAFEHFKQALREIKKSSAFFGEMEADLNQYCNGIMDKLKQQVPSIAGENRKLIALFFAGVPAEWIQVLMNKNSTGSLKTSRSRFRQAIKEAHAQNESLFLEMLEVRKSSRGTKQSDVIAKDFSPAAAKSQ